MKQKSTRTPTISVIITAHSEGILIHRTLASVRRAILSLPHTVPAEIILHVDNATPSTIHYLDSHHDKLSDVTIYKNHFGDLGQSRNFAISKAKGKYVATIDADDIMSRNWLAQSIPLLEAASEPTVAHSEYTVEFEGANSLIIKHGEIDYETDALLSVFANRWNSVIVTQRQLMLDNPYTPNSPGYGYEDWHFNCRTIHQRAHNILVPGTAIFVRRRHTNSEWARQIASRAVLRANPLFAFRNIRQLKNPFELHSKKSSQKNSSRSLLSKQGIKHKISHYPVVYKAIKRGRQILKQAVTRNFRTTPIVPVWLTDEWLDLHTIDKQLFPDETMLKSLPIYDTITPSHIAAGDCYKQLIDQTNHDSYTYIIFAPWLAKGGADKYTIDYANAIANISQSAVLIVTTLDHPSPWKEKVSKDVDVVDFGSITAGVDEGIKHRIMEHIVENSGATTLHIINSEYGYKFVRDHSEYITATNKKVVVSSFSQSIDPATNRIYGYSHTHVPFIYEITSLIISDNQAVINMWEKEYGFDPNRMILLQQCIELNGTNPRHIYKTHSPISVLWASRISHEKMPEIVAEIASRLNDSFRIDMYGSLESGFESLVSGLPVNVVYKGSYDGFDSIDSSKYDIYLYTSLFDGVPNMILEAASAGLPIIASDVGGISEFLTSKTGVCIQNIYDPQKYVDAINFLAENERIRKELGAGAYKKIHTNYSRARYNESVKLILDKLAL